MQKALSALMSGNYLHLLPSTDEWLSGAVLQDFLNLFLFGNNEGVKNKRF
jgi:hypothetical protein